MCSFLTDTGTTTIVATALVEQSLGIVELIKRNALNSISKEK